MKNSKIKVTIIKEDKGYSATTLVGKDFIGTQAESYDKLKINILEAVNLVLENNLQVSSMDDLRITLDLNSFFDFYKVINAKALSERIGMNQSLLAQYISGKKKPSTNQTLRIMQGVHQIGRELTEIKLKI